MLNEVYLLDEKYFPYPWSKSQWRDSLNTNEFVLVCRQFESQLIGFCFFAINQWEKQGHLLKILVMPSKRKADYATVLHQAALDHPLMQGLKSLYLEVAASNTAALSLYHKLGYASLVSKKKYYSDGSDAVAMQRRLN